MKDYANIIFMKASAGQEENSEVVNPPIQTSRKINFSKRRGMFFNSRDFPNAVHGHHNRTR